ncbi:hypothetical protein [Nocardia sp. NPDC058666]|uniref:hypothetical protein n=1 Tax=unclassified Nocardia TaxID=2637762 RepID=UPI003650F820
MSTATSALRSLDSTAVPETKLRRRRNARTARPFALVRPTLSRPSVDRGLPAVPRPSTEADSTIARGIVRSGVLVGANDSSVDIARVARRIELTDAELDLAFATVPRSAPAFRTRDLARPSSDRGPRHRAPRSELSLYARGSVGPARHARGAHPLHRIEQAKTGFAALAVTALVTALIVVAFLGLAHVRAGSFVDHVDSSIPGISEQAGLPSGGMPSLR